MIFVQNVIISMNQVAAKTDQTASQDYRCFTDKFVTIFHSPNNITACTAGEGAHISFGGQHFNLNREGFLCLSDLLHQRFNIFVSSFIASQCNLPQYPSMLKLKEFFAWGDKILGTLGQKGYSIIKQLEPICTAVLIERRRKNL